jgi:hypothetical protein
MPSQSCDKTRITRQTSTRSKSRGLPGPKNLPAVTGLAKLDVGESGESGKMGKVFSLIFGEQNKFFGNVFSELHQSAAGGGQNFPHIPHFPRSMPRLAI